EPGIDLGDAAVGYVLGKVEPVHAEISRGGGGSGNLGVKSPTPVVVIRIPGQESTANGVDLAEFADQDSRTQFGDHRVRTLGKADGGVQAGVLRGGHHSLGVGPVSGQRLFDNDMDSALDRFDGVRHVQPVRAADVKHVGLGLVEHDAEVIEGIY